MMEAATAAAAIDIAADEIFQPFSVNSVVLLGTLSHVVVSDSGMGIKAEFRVTTRERRVRGRHVTVHQQTHHCIGWGGIADRVSRYGREGMIVHVRGELRYRRYGDSGEHLAVEIATKDIVFSSAE